MGALRAAVTCRDGSGGTGRAANAGAFEVSREYFCGAATTQIYATVCMLVALTGATGRHFWVKLPLGTSSPSTP